MNLKMIIRPEAEKDLDDAFSWYEERRKGLGYDFLLQVEAGLRFIEKYPLALSDIYKGVRRYIIKRFPYIIFYSIDNHNVIVLAVLHSGRDPDWIKKRIKSI
jgi:plasmid stabilization system protein ParE